MAKKMGLYDRAVRDFLPYGNLHKVEREKDRPWINEHTLSFLTKKGVVKEEGGGTLLTIGEGWKILGKVGTRAGRYIEPVNPEQPDKD